MKLSIVPLQSRPTQPNHTMWATKSYSQTVNRQRRLKSARKWVVIGIVVLFGLAGVAVIVHSKLLTVKSITVTAQVSSTPQLVPVDQLIQSANKLKGQSLVFLPTASIQSQWLKQYPSIQSIVLEKHYPYSLTVRYLPRIALCQLVAQDGTYLVDRTGFIFAKAGVATLPTLTVDKPSFRVGTTVSIQDVALGLKLVDGLRGSNPKLVSAVLHDNQIDIQLAGPPLIFVGSGKSADEVLSQISQLLHKFAADNKYPKELDLRFDRPVLRY